MSLELPTLGTDTNTHLNKICSTCIYKPSTERSIKTGSLTACEHLRPLFASHEQGLSHSQLFMRVTSLTRRCLCQRPCVGIALTTPRWPAIATLEVWELRNLPAPYSPGFCHSRARMVPPTCFLIIAVHTDVEVLEAY